MKIKSIPRTKIRFFQRRLLSWFKENGRHHFIWRRPGNSVYKIIIAEILLQRTRAETVEKFYPNFIKNYPTWTSIVNDYRENLENFLKPIGLFKQRAAGIMALANIMVLRNGRLPRNRVEFETLPMFGQYISNAVKLQIFKDPEPLLDTNMARVLERFFGRRELSDIRYDPYLQNLSHSVVHHKEPKLINWAILDFAAAICRAKNPICLICSLSIYCIYFKTNENS
jgi:A/G-specific adenine glycosylase